MVTEFNQQRISRVLIRLVSGFSTFVLAVMLSTHFHPLGPNFDPGDIDSQLSPIVVAKFEIPAGTRLTDQQLRVARIPRKHEIEGAFQKIDNNLLGQVTVARVSEGEPITASHLGLAGSNSDLSLIIPEGYRGMTVKVDDVVGINGFIMPGTLVDIVMIIDRASGKGEGDKIFKIVLNNIKVLASAQKYKPRTEKEIELMRTVTLLVTQEQAEKLALAASEGKLQLVMLSHSDETGDDKSKKKYLAPTKHRIDLGLLSREERP